MYGQATVCRYVGAHECRCWRRPAAWNELQNSTEVLHKSGSSLNTEPSLHPQGWGINRFQSPFLVCLLRSPPLVPCMIVISLFFPPGTQCSQPKFLSFCLCFYYSCCQFWRNCRMWCQKISHQENLPMSPPALGGGISQLLSSLCFQYILPLSLCHLSFFIPKETFSFTCKSAS